MGSTVAGNTIPSSPRRTWRKTGCRLDQIDVLDQIEGLDGINGLDQIDGLDQTDTPAALLVLTS